MSSAPPKFCPRQSDDPPVKGIQQLGQAGEARIAEELMVRGWRILALNFRVRGAELDVVAFKQGCLLVVEVKTRRSATIDREKLLPVTKQEALRRGLSIYLTEKLPKDLWLSIKSVRIDLAIVAWHNNGSKIEWYTNAVEL